MMAQDVYIHKKKEEEIKHTEHTINIFVMFLRLFPLSQTQIEKNIHKKHPFVLLPVWITCTVDHV